MVIERACRRGDGALLQLWYRGVLVRVARDARVHRSGHDHQVRGVLPRSRRSVPRQGGFGRHHPRLAGFSGRAAAATSTTLCATYNDLDEVKALFAEHKDKIAGVILEPVVGNSGFIVPDKEFLQGLREVCTAEGAVLCFDEVMTGFRIAKGCAQEYWGVTPDLTTMGKVIGGGMPVGAYGGKREIMDMVAPARVRCTKRAPCPVTRSPWSPVSRPSPSWANRVSTKSWTR